MAADGIPDVPHEGETRFVEREIYLQVELYADEENDSIETKRKKRMARAALTSWKENIEKFQRMILQGESEMRSIMNEVYQLVSLYSVFVGVVLTAVATSSRLECEHLWSPVALSLFAYFIVVVVAFTKFEEIRELIQEKKTRKRDTKEILVWVKKLRTMGYADFDFERDCQEKRYPFLRVPYVRNALGLLIPLTIFTVGLVFSLVHILCWS